MTYPVIISQYCHPCYTFRLLYLKTRTCYKQFSFYIYFLTSILILYHAKNHFHVGWKIFFYLSFLIIESRGLNMRIFTPVKNWNLFSKLTDHREKRIFRSTVFMNTWKNTVITPVMVDRIWTSNFEECITKPIFSEI